MNTGINNVAIASLEATASIRTLRLQDTAAKAGYLVLGLIKIVMISAPFLSMLMMILALWGVAGKTTYTDLDATKQGIAFGANEAKNYMVNETKTIEKCPEELESQYSGRQKVKPLPNNIDWKNTV